MINLLKYLYALLVPHFSTLRVALKELPGTPDGTPVEIIGTVDSLTPDSEVPDAVCDVLIFAWLGYGKLIKKTSPVVPWSAYVESLHRAADDADY